MTADLVMTRARLALVRLVLVLLLLAPFPALAQNKIDLFSTIEDGFARMVLTFPDRTDLPTYTVRYENGVLAIEFDDAVALVMPDVAVALPGYVTVARMDPDRKGMRFGLRTTFNLHHMEAGEKLFIDLMPLTWQGLPPSLPDEVVAELSVRARDAALRAAQQQKAAEARLVKPTARLRVGRNPTFVRVEFNWNVPTQGAMSDDVEPAIHFDWPVPIDLYAFKADLPPEILNVRNAVTADGSEVKLTMAPGIQPRFYRTSETQFLLDFDITPAAPPPLPVDLPSLVESMSVVTTDVASLDAGGTGLGEAPDSLTPTVSDINGTVRVTFPFDRDTAAAVFRRGDTVWMLFDTPTRINNPAESASLSAIASAFTALPAGDTQVVRLDLDVERLSTLASEGRAWVLSLGDVLLNPTEPLPLTRKRNENGEFEMIAGMAKPARLHQFRDPVVGDVLSVVTAFPPARGVMRPLDYVDFGALPSVHGLVVRPNHDNLKVNIVSDVAVISTPGGLDLSASEQARIATMTLDPTQRGTYVDLIDPHVEDPAQMKKRGEELITMAATVDGAGRDEARLELAQFYLANRLAQEAIGVLEVLTSELKTEELRRPTQLTRGIADTMAFRPREALEVLSTASLADDPDATMWRTIARADANDFAGARLDAMASEGVIDSYPRWVRTRFLFAAIRAGVETNDFALASRYLKLIEFAKLEPEDATWYQFFAARIAEANGNVDEALDEYGQVIAADVRPTRAEAVYRTLLLLDRTGRIDMTKATQTLSAEVLLWRGDRLEVLMQKFLAELYMRNNEYRLGFEAVRVAVQHFPVGSASNALLDQAQVLFADLYLNGRADTLEPVEALSLYYDFRELTPAGARGDEMIRNLARRLVKVDLLAQAADLLEYQIDYRLKGAAQAQVAAELAAIRIADRQPRAALRVLNRTRLADLPPSLDRQRRILEARALIDADRQDLAIDLLATVVGRDADLLRIDGLWKSNQFQAASELLELAYSPTDRADTLARSARLNIVKAGVGFVLAGDSLGLSRLRSKFAARMANSAEWPVFNFVTSEVNAHSVEFRKVAREVSGLDSLNAFLTNYRELYPASADTLPAAAAATNAL